MQMVFLGISKIKLVTLHNIEMFTEHSKDPL
jgi:hypothetical protein